MTLTGFWCFWICPTPLTVFLEVLCSPRFAGTIPWMAPWAGTCDRHDSNLLVGGSCIQSRRGVQQGDPLGPSLFSLAVHPFIVEAVRISEAQYPSDLDFQAFFLDDGTIAGKAQAVKLFLDTLERLLLDIGLVVARDKTKVVPACSSVQNFTPQDFDGCCWVTDGNFKLLEAAFGSKDWCEALLDRRVCKARTLLGGHQPLPRFARGVRPPAFLHGMGQGLVLMPDSASSSSGCRPLQC